MSILNAKLPFNRTSVELKRFPMLLGLFVWHTLLIEPVWN